MSNLKELQFKTKLTMPPALSFIDSNDEICRGSIEMKAGIATLYHDEVTGKKITVPFWGYALAGEAASYLGPTIEVNSQQCIEIDWKNQIGLDNAGNNQYLHQPVVAIKVQYDRLDGEKIPQNRLGAPDGSPMTMGAKGEAYVTPHQHGGKTAPKYDGGPLDMLSVGQSHIHRYNNNQRAAMLWYHDHAMHTTRLNVVAGLAALYVIRDEEEKNLNLPTGDYELPLVIQDRNLDDADKIDALITNSCASTAKVNLLHKVEFGKGPLEFFGPLNLVNGSIWPIKEVEGACYRVRILNGANSRSYRLLFAEKDQTAYQLCNDIKIKQIGTDGGLIPSKNNQLIDLPAEGLTLAPAERADLLIDFSNVTGKKIYMLNTANSPFAGSSIAIEDIANIDPDRDENRNPYPEVMCFDVKSACSARANTMDYKHLAHCMALLKTYIQEAPRFEDITKTRTIAVVEKDTPHGAVLVLWELMQKAKLANNPNHPILNAQREIVVDGEEFVAVAERFHDPVSMIIPEGSTERWRFINLTADTHPMHIHLVQYLPLSRRNILSVNGEDIVDNDDKGDQILKLTADNIASGAAISLAVEAMDDATDLNMNVDDNEQGLKDTMRVNPGEMIEIMARFEEHCGRFVYHCHLLEHEDHDMMRQFIVTRNDLMGNHMLPISVGA